MPPPYALDRARSRLLGPAIGLLASALLCLLSAPVFTVNSLSHRVAMGNLPADPSARLGETFILYSICGLLVVLAALVIGGAIAMLTVRNYPLAWTGVIAALLPCSPCVVVGIPFAIWGITVLVDPAVRSCFYRPAGT